MNKENKMLYFELGNYTLEELEALKERIDDAISRREEIQKYILDKGNIF